MAWALIKKTLTYYEDWALYLLRDGIEELIREKDHLQLEALLSYNAYSFRICSKAVDSSEFNRGASRCLDR